MPVMNDAVFNNRIICGRDIERFSCYSQSAVVECLNEMGIDLTKATILRFVQNGYIFAPQRRAVASGEGRIFYNPLAIIEAATASLLFKGDFLSSSSETRITRLTGEDLFVARLLFYLNYYTDYKQFDISAFNTYSKHYVKNSSHDKELFEMTERNIAEYFEFYNAMRLEKFGEDRELLRVYNNLASYIYRKTFSYLYDKHSILLTYESIR